MRSRLLRPTGYGLRFGHTVIRTAGFVVLVAIRKSDGARVEGRDAERGAEYICPGSDCKCKVILRKPILRIVDHFAHERGATCNYSQGETREHRTGKSFLLSAFRSRQLRAEPEVPLEILSSEEDRRADVLVWHPRTDQQIAFEVQHTMLGLKDIMRRTESYAAGKVPVVWINLLKPNRVEKAFRVQGANINHVRKYATHAWERWAHDFSDERGADLTSRRGHLWFLDPSTGLMWRGWFSAHYLYEDSSEFYDSSGDYQSYSGGWYVSERYHILNLEGPFELATLRIKLHHRAAGKEGAYKYPFGTGAWLLAPTDDDNEGPTRPLLRTHQADIMPIPQICRDGEWIDIERDQAIDPAALWQKQT
jgi:hypothetical protein